MARGTSPESAFFVRLGSRINNSRCLSMMFSWTSHALSQSFRSTNLASTTKSRSTDIRAVGRELGARYVVEGSIRKGGRALPINAQLVDAASGAQLGAETYNRKLGDGGPFETLDDVTDRIVATVAGGHGVIARPMATATREKLLEEASASQLVSRWFTYTLQIKAEEHARLRAAFERVLDREPNHADAWACLSNLYCWEYVHRLNPLEKPMERALEAAWRAVTIDPACQLGWQQLAEAHFFARDYTAFGDAAERAMALKPRNSHTRAYLGLLIAFSGEWDRGLALVQRAPSTSSRSVSLGTMAVYWEITQWQCSSWGSRRGTRTSKLISEGNVANCSLGDPCAVASDSVLGNLP